ncbi:5427_t:CDS:2, partial [Gigaspora margarita]
MFAGKFVIENLEQHVTVFCANVIAIRDSNHEFEANKILISVPHCMFHVIVSRELKECKESTYFEAGIRTGRSFIVSEFISRITSDFVIFEVTDIDFMTSNVNIVQDVKPSITLTISEHHSDIDIIAEDANSNIPWAVKRPRRLTSRPLKQSSGLSTINDESVAPSQDPGSSTNIIEDAPKDDDKFEILEESIVEVPKKNK